MLQMYVQQVYLPTADMCMCMGMGEEDIHSDTDIINIMTITIVLLYCTAASLIIIS